MSAGVERSIETSGFRLNLLRDASGNASQVSITCLTCRKAWLPRTVREIMDLSAQHGPAQCATSETA